MFVHKRRAACVAVGVVSVASLVANAGMVYAWVNPVDGNWNVGGNWSTGLVPGSGSEVLLGLSGAYTVSVSGGQSSAAMSVTNPDAVIALLGASSLSIYGDVVNNGEIRVNSNASGFTTTLGFFSPASISGSGRFVLAGPSTRARIQGTDTITQGASHSIVGFGQIEPALVNNGTVAADSDGNMLVLISNPKTNNAQMNASSGGILEVNGITLTQSSAGTVEAQAGSRVQLKNSTVIGGALSSNGDGFVDINGTSTLTGVDFDGRLDIPGSYTLNISNSITNDGMIRLNTNTSGFVTTINVLDDSSFSGSGEIVMAGPGTRARLGTNDALLTNTSTHTIRGYGQIEAALVNNGTVSADSNGNELTLNVNAKTNNAEMNASGGGIMTTNGITLTQGASGVIEAQAGSQVRLTNSTVIGGDLFSSGDGFVGVVGTSTLTGVNFDGRLDIPGSYTLNISNSITNDGIINLNTNASGFVTTINVLDDSSFSGNGEIVMAGSGTRALLKTTNAMLTNTTNHTTHGFGQIQAALVNNGTVAADSDGNTLVLISNPKTNNAQMNASGGGILEVNGITLTQSSAGTVEAQAGSRVQLKNSTVIGGALSSSGDGFVDINGTSTLTGVDFDGRLDIPGSYTLNMSGSALNNGTITVNTNSSGFVTTLNFADASELGGAGTIRLSQAGSRSWLTSAQGATLGADQRLEGIGLIATALLHKGTLAPGLSVGTMTATQPVELAGSSVFEAEVNAAGGDKLSSTAAVALDGTLEVIYADGFAPAGFWARTIITASSITGKFTAINAPAPAPGFVTRVVNTGTAVIVGQTCPSDTNLDGMLNFFDVSTFLNAFASQLPVADLNNDGVYNFFDVSLFLNNFAAGCPL